MYFETGLRDFAVERSLDLSLYTGTHGVGWHRHRHRQHVGRQDDSGIKLLHDAHQVCQLEDVNGVMVDIHLYNGDMLPVPRFHNP